MYIIVDLDPNADDEEEKQRLIEQILERQNTLDGKIFVDVEIVAVIFVHRILLG